MRLSGTTLNKRITEDLPETGCVISKKKASKRSKEPKKGNGSLATVERESPPVKVRDYESHVLVCKGSDCKKRGSKDVRKALKSELRAEGMNREVRVDCVDCLGLCKHGPNAIIYPGGTWYLGLIEEDVPEIVETHLKGGEPVEWLSAERRSGKAKKGKK